MSQSQVTELVQHKEVHLVVDWLKHGAKRIDVGVHKDSVEAELTIIAAEKMLKTKFYSFQHKKHEGITIQRAIFDYSVPADLARVVQLVGNTVRFPSVRSPRLVEDSVGARSETVGDWVQDCKACGTSKVTPGVIRKRYSCQTTLSMATLLHLWLWRNFKGKHGIRQI